MRLLVKLLFFASLALMAAAFWRKDALPPPSMLLEQLQAEPKQTAVVAQSADVTVNGIQYRIHPRYAYELSGLVVSLHDAETWWDYAHREWSDFLNVMDLCVIWGGNARNGSYRSVTFSSTEWECFWRWSEAGLAFDGTAAANNHLITSDPALAHRLRQVRIGDQVRFRGYLADYTVFRNGAPAGMRTTSTVRNDSGNGACEIVYLEDFEILRPSPGIWRMIGKLALLAFLASVIGWFCLPLPR
jgi:hypothetical protein